MVKKNTHPKENGHFSGSGRQLDFYQSVNALPKAVIRREIGEAIQAVDKAAKDPSAEAVVDAALHKYTGTTWSGVGGELMPQKLKLAPLALSVMGKHLSGEFQVAAHHAAALQDRRTCRDLQANFHLIGDQMIKAALG